MIDKYGIILSSDLGSIDRSNLVLNGLRYSVNGVQVRIEWTTDEVPADISSVLIGANISDTAMIKLIDTAFWGNGDIV